MNQQEAFIEWVKIQQATLAQHPDFISTRKQKKKKTDNTSSNNNNNKSTCTACEKVGRATILLVFQPI